MDILKDSHYSYLEILSNCSRLRSHNLERIFVHTEGVILYKYYYLFIYLFIYRMQFTNEQRHDSYDGGLYRKFVSKLPYFTACSLWAKK